MSEKRTRSLTLNVSICVAQTGWNTSALVFEDHNGDTSPKKVTLKIGCPNEVAYIRERLQNIEDAWRKEIEMVKP